MQSNFNKLSEADLKNVIADAGKELRAREEVKRKEVIAEIKKLAATIGVTVEISDSEKKSGRKGRKVPSKYKNPNDPAQKWSGRGMKPKWLKALLDQGYKLEKLEIKR